MDRGPVGYMDTVHEIKGLLHERFDISISDLWVTGFDLSLSLSLII